MTTRLPAAIALALVRLGHRRPWRVLIGAAAVVALGIWGGTRLKFDTDVLNLMPRNDRVVVDFRSVLEQFGTLDTLLVAVDVGSEERLETALVLVDALAEELRRSPHLAHVESQLEDPIKLAEAVIRNAVLFLDEEGLRQLEARLSDEGLAARASDIRAAVDTPLGMLAKEFSTRDPLGLLPMLLGRVSSTPSALRLDYSSGYLLSEDHTLVLLLAKPVRPAQDIAFDERLFEDLGERIARTRAAVAGELGVEPADVPTVMLGGGHRIAVEDATLIKRDVILNSVSSVAGVMVLFFLAYRRFATAHYAFLPLTVGLALTFGFASVTLGELSSATAGFAALLVGLGIDFTIVLYGRYIEARRAGHDIGGALEEMAAHSGPAVMLGAVTTVGTFFAFFLTRFSGLRELGLLTGTGIVLMGVSAFVLLPALVTIFDHGKEPPSHSRWLDLSPAIDWSMRHRRLVLGVLLAGTAALVALLPRIEFVDDARNLRAPGNQGVVVQERIAAAYGLSFNAMMIRVSGPSEDEVLRRLRRLGDGLDELIGAGTLSSYQSVAMLVPPPESQRSAIEWARSHRALTDPTRVEATLSTALAAQGLVPGAFGDGLRALGEALNPTDPVTLDVWRGTPVATFIERSFRSDGGEVATVVNVFPPPGKWRREAPPELIELVGGIPGATLTGVNIVSARLREIVWRDALIAGLVGILVVVAILMWELRSVGWSVACLIPVAVGVLWTLGAMAAFGLALNLLNVFVITMVIGIGSDYGIHMLHRLREGAGGSEVAETARAVALAALTTVVGFGSLVTTHYPGLQSIGWMTSMGVVLSCLTAVLVLPIVV
ncbi:MAG: MMPL family transporter, partial [Acidobacteriota bacterium]